MYTKNYYQDKKILTTILFILVVFFFSYPCCAANLFSNSDSRAPEEEQAIARAKRRVADFYKEKKRTIEKQKLKEAKFENKDNFYYPGKQMPTAIKDRYGIKTKVSDNADKNKKIKKEIVNQQQTKIVTDKYLRIIKILFVSGLMLFISSVFYGYKKLKKR